MFVLEGIDHVALAVRNLDRSIAWYQDVLGLERWFEDVWGDMPAVVGIGTTAIALFPVDGADGRGSDKDPLSMHHVAFRVDAVNFADARSDLERLDIPYRFQDHEISQSIYFHDPDGHTLEITTYEV